MLSNYSTEVLLEYSKDMIREGLTLSGIVENSLRNNVSNCKSAIDSLKWKMKVANDSLRQMGLRLEEFGESKFSKYSTFLHVLYDYL